MIVEVAGDHQLIGLRARQELAQAFLHRIRGTDERARQGVFDTRFLRRGPEPFDIVDGWRHLPGPPASQIQERLLQRGEVATGFGVRIRCEHVDREHRVGSVELFRRLERRPIHFQRAHHLVRREVRGEGVGQAERGGDLRAIQAGAEDPQRHFEAFAGHGAQRLAFDLWREVGLQLLHIVRELLGSRSEIPAQRACRELIRSRCTPEPEIDSIRIQRCERAELLCDDQRRVVRQHDAARADANGPGAAGDVPDDDRRGRARDSFHAVMFGEPEAQEPEFFRSLRKAQRVAERVGGRCALRDGGEIQNGERNHGRNFATSRLADVSPRREISRAE